MQIYALTSRQYKMKLKSPGIRKHYINGMLKQGNFRMHKHGKKKFLLPFHKTLRSQLAARLGFGDVYWDWDKPRGREGYFAIRGGVEICIDRAVSFSPYADLLWMETKDPNLKDAR
jgi:isocitrate lyase